MVVISNFKNNNNAMIQHSIYVVAKGRNKQGMNADRIILNCQTKVV